MSSNATSKLLFILAASSMSKKEIIEAIQDISLMSIGDIDELLTEIKKLYPKFSQEIINNYFQPTAYPGSEYGKNENTFISTGYKSPGKSSGKYSDVSYEIDRLLRGEAGLKAVDAASWLTKEIKNEMGNILIPNIGKGAFRNWVERISKKVPPSLLLHLATKIRNSAVHGVDKDWPLR